MNQKILNSNMSIRWVVALKAEAEIILDEYNMNFDPEFTLFQVFRNFEKTRWLILSGIGRHNSAAATMYLYMIICTPIYHIDSNICVCIVGVCS